VVLVPVHAMTALAFVYLQTKKEYRKLAYDILLNISCTLKDTESTDQESSLQRLLNMVSLTALNMPVLWLQLVSTSLKSDLFTYIDTHTHTHIHTQRGRKDAKNRKNNNIKQQETTRK